MCVIIVGLPEASRILKSRMSPSITHIVSIGAPEQNQGPPDGFDNHSAEKMRLIFHDINGDDRGSLIAPKREHIEALVVFYTSMLSGSHNLLIHCQAGASRSTAAGLILMSMESDDPIEVVHRLLKLKPRAHPNRTMIRLANEVMNKESEWANKVEDELYRLSQAYRFVYGKR